MKPHHPHEGRFPHTPIPYTGNFPVRGSARDSSDPQPATKQDDVLSSLRSSWVEDYEISPEKARRRPVKRGPGIGAIAAEVFALVKKLARDLPRAVVTMAKGAAELFFGRNVAAMLGGGGFLLLLGGVVAVGAMAYAGSVGHMFGSGPAASGGKAGSGRFDMSAIYVETTQPAMISVPKTRDDSVSAVGETLGNQSGGMAPNWNGGSAVAASQAKLEGANDQLDASPQLQDVGGIVSATSGQDAYERAPAEQSARGNPPGGSDRGGVGGGGSAQSILRQSNERPEPAAAWSQGSQRDSSRPVRDAVVDQKDVMALERAQVMAATGASRGDVERTALEAIGHGGRAAFEVQYVDSRTGAPQPARILLTATTISFVPEATGDMKAFSIPLRSARVGGSDASLMDIEFNQGEKTGQLSLRDSSNQAPALLSHVRNVIRALQ